MPTMMFYERLAPLNRDAHGRLRAKLGSAAFAARANSVPLLVTEMAAASRSYPILFVDIGADQLFPVAMLGLSAGENLFVDEEGAWQAGVYIPAFVRRYPFVLASDMTVLIDEDYAGWSESEGEPLFNEDGSNSPALEQTLAFLRSFQDEVAHSQAFIASLREHELLKSANIAVPPPDAEGFTIEGLMLVDAEKLAALSDEAVLGLFRSGALQQIHAHLSSLEGLQSLEQRAAERNRVPSASRSARKKRAAAALPRKA